LVSQVNVKVKIQDKEAHLRQCQFEESETWKVHKNCSIFTYAKAQKCRLESFIASQQIAYKSYYYYINYLFTMDSQ